mmetsp:Transcript_4727/g.14772  ORF Transcript_4727/g.14772 Transcript_4727/m.14772 type:complete len:463 (+) Transcript_4727:306-1694(+)
MADVGAGGYPARPLRVLRVVLPATGRLEPSHVRAGLAQQRVRPGREFAYQHHVGRRLAEGYGPRPRALRQNAAILHAVRLRHPGGVGAGGRRDERPRHERLLPRDGPSHVGHRCDGALLRGPRDLALQGRLLLVHCEASRGRPRRPRDLAGPRNPRRHLVGGDGRAHGRSRLRKRLESLGLLPLRRRRPQTGQTARALRRLLLARASRNLRRLRRLRRPRRRARDAPLPLRRRPRPESRLQRHRRRAPGAGGRRPSRRLQLLHAPLQARHGQHGPPRDHRDARLREPHLPSLRSAPRRLGPRRRSRQVRPGLRPALQGPRPPARRAPRLRPRRRQRDRRPRLRRLRPRGRNDGLRRHDLSLQLRHQPRPAQRSPTLPHFPAAAALIPAATQTAGEDAALLLLRLLLGESCSSLLLFLIASTIGQEYQSLSPLLHTSSCCHMSCLLLLRVFYSSRLTPGGFLA